MITRTRSLLVGLMLALVVMGCRQSADLPTPIATPDDVELMALAAIRPTLPPTFTPSPIWTATFTATLPATDVPRATLTLTPTVESSATRTRTPVPTLSPTWTPDTRLLPPTQIQPAGGNTPTPVDTPVVIVSGTPATPGPAASGQCAIPASVENLLQNAGFEGPSYTQVHLPEFVTPERWVVFWKPEGTPTTYDPDNPDGYRRPQMQVIQNAPPFTDPPRIMEGNQAVYIFGGGKVYDAGLYQQVTVAQGDVLCLTGFAHGWSARQTDDPHVSLLNTADDRRNMNFQLGIDPTGGTDAFAASVTWGSVGNLFDQYQPVPSVRVTAAGTTITVFVRGYNMWRFEHNDMFFDQIKLSKIGG